MSSINLGEPISFSFNCTNQLGALFDPDVVQVSLVKDHSLEDPSTSLYEDTLTYGGSDPRDSQLTKLAVGSYAVVYTTDRVGRWSCLPRWSDAGLPAGAMVTSRSPYLVDVEPTEHQFIDREAMIPPGGGEPVSVPYATDTTGGMLTDQMAVRFAAMSTAARSYYEANWAHTGWWIDAANGLDTNTGREDSPLQSVEELSARLAVPCDVDHTITVRLAQGATYGDFFVAIRHSALGCPFRFIGTVARIPVGTIATITGRSVGDSVASHLTIAGVSDMTSLINSRLDVTDGTYAGAITHVAEKNPGGLGVNVARFCAFSELPKAGDTDGLGVATVTPSVGAAVSTTTLPQIASISINQVGPLVTGGADIWDRACAHILDVAVGSLNVSSVGRVYVNGCTFTGPVAIENKNVYLDRCLFLSTATLADVTSQNCTHKGAVSASGTFYLSYGLFQGPTAYCTAEGGTVYRTGFFGCTTLEPMRTSTARTRKSTFSQNYGNENIRCALMCQNNIDVSAPGNYFLGGTGHIYFYTKALILPFTVIPYLDGEQSFEATLAVPGAGHTAEATSYVDVTVKQMLVATQKMQATYKTFAGATGSLRIVYIDATTVRIVSSSATDTSIVTGSVFAVGDNVIVRS
jgi:hypothetical protein